MGKYYVYACDKNGNNVCVYMDERGIERSSSILHAVDSNSLAKVINFAIEYYQADHVKIFPAN